jgi:hypothetical protein
MYDEDVVCSTEMYQVHCGYVPGMIKLQSWNNDEAVVCSTEMHKVHFGNGPGMIRLQSLTMYDEAVVYSTELQKLCGYWPGIIMVCVELLVFHRATPRLADRGMLTR